MIIKVDENRSLDLSVVPISEIKPHEDTIPLLLESLKRDMSRTGFQRDPILIDRNSKLALDGMHRRAALKIIGARFAICSQYDYLSNVVKLERWLRYYIAPSQRLLSQIISTFHMKSVDDFEEAVQRVDSKKSGIALLSAVRSYVSEDNSDILDIYQSIAKVDLMCQAAGVEVQFASDADKFSLFSSESVFVLYPLRLTKQDVLDMAKNNYVFPFKTTRHIVPVRPMGIHFPLEYLKEKSYSICERELDEIVNFSKIEVEPIDIWYEGRRYSEPLAIFRRTQE